MKEKKIPMRKCIGCNVSQDKRDLIRIASYEGQLSVDETNRAKGRGVYLCRNSNCLEVAKKRKAFSRSLKMEVKQEDLDKITDYFNDNIGDKNEK